MSPDRGLAVVTGASSGIGYQLARCCAQDGFDLVIAADEPQIERAAFELRQHGCFVDAVEADLATQDGVEALYAATAGRPVNALIANAGRGMGGAFLDQDFRDVLHVLDTNVTGTLHLLHLIGRDMRGRGAGRILITGSIAGFFPGPLNAVYNATKAFVDSFAQALRNELKDTGVTVTCLMPGATDTQFFARAHMLDTRLGTGDKDDAAHVAREGFRAMMSGEDQVITGVKNELEAAAAHLAPADLRAEQHRQLAQPGSADR
jgi:short-subunit dehydrogenase